MVSNNLLEIYSKYPFSSNQLLNDRKKFEDILIASIIYNRLRNPWIEGLRWTEIRDLMLNLLSLSPSNDELKTFNMKLTRVLNGLVKEEILIKNQKGHKNTVYLGNVDYFGVENPIKLYSGMKLFFREYSKIELPILTFILLSIPSFEKYNEFKNNILEAILYHIEPKIKSRWNEHLAFKNKGIPHVQPFTDNIERWRNNFKKMKIPK